jgi:hypothetical protein
VLFTGNPDELLDADVEAPVGILGVTWSFGEAGVVVLDERQQKGVGRLDRIDVGQPQRLDRSVLYRV